MMKVKVIKDATVTVKAGQVVEVKDGDAISAIKLGLAVPFEETKKKRTGK